MLLLIHRTRTIVSIMTVAIADNLKMIEALVLSFVDLLMINLSFCFLAHYIIFCCTISLR